MYVISLLIGLVTTNIFAVLLVIRLSFASLTVTWLLLFHAALLWQLLNKIHCLLPSLGMNTRYCSEIVFPMVSNDFFSLRTQPALQVLYPLNQTVWLHVLSPQFCKHFYRDRHVLDVSVNNGNFMVFNTFYITVSNTCCYRVIRECSTRCYSTFILRTKN